MKYKVFGQIAPHICKLKDVTVQGDTITFGSSWEKTAAESVVTHATSQNTKAKESGQIVKKELSATDKTRISEMVGGEVLANIDALGVYEFIASTDEVDTDGDVFNESLLRQWAVQYADGVPFVFRHDYDYGIGSTFKAEVIRNNEKSRWELIVGVYVLPTAKLETDTAKTLIDGGVYKKCSIRARTGMPNYISSDTSPTGQSMWVYGADEMAKALELSLVPWGANQSATRIKEQKDKQFILLSDNMNVKLKHLGDIEKEVTAEMVKDMSEKLHSYQEKEAALRTEKENLFTNKSLIVTPDANKTHLEVLAKALPILDLEKEIQLLTEKEAAMKNGLNPENKTAGETTLKANSNPANSFQ